MTASACRLARAHWTRTTTPDGAGTRAELAQHTRGQVVTDVHTERLIGDQAADELARCGRSHCRDGWLSDTDADLVVACAVCRPHLARRTRSLNGANDFHARQRAMERVRP